MSTLYTIGGIIFYVLALGVFLVITFLLSSWLVDWDGTFNSAIQEATGFAMLCFLGIMLRVFLAQGNHIFHMLRIETKSGEPDKDK